ncbi:MAG: ABC transporter ATP-binding protein [Lachnospiraceae bacterium]
MPEQKKSSTPGFGGAGPGAGHLGRPLEKIQLKNARGTLKRVLGYMLNYKRSMILAFIFAGCYTFVTIIGTRLNGYVIDTFIAQKNIRLLGIICLVMAGMYAFGVFSQYIQNVIMIRVSQNTSKALRQELFERIHKLTLKYFDSHSSGDIMSRLTNDVDNITTAMSQTMVQLFTSLISVVSILIVMLLISPLMTLVCLLSTSITFFTARFIVKKSQTYYVSQQQELGSLNGYIEEMISGQKVLRQFSREQQVIDELNEINDRYVSDAIRAQGASSVIGPTNNMINNFAYLLVAVVGGTFIIKDMGSLTVGLLFSFLLYLRNFSGPLNSILNLFNTIQLALASAERVFETMDEEPEQDDDDAAEISNIRGDIRLEHVDFSYVPDKPVLQDATITACPGETVAIVGPTGAGKTTIISLLTRFYDIDGGKILIDGRSVEHITRHSLRQSVALVLQDTFLFSDTIRENIRYGRIDATDQEVEAAAIQARAHEFIKQLPKGYDTVLSDNGQNLSQGQRQLLGITRAIISRASVLILDEATSSVDTRTELIIQEGLLALMDSNTSFVIAHRLSTIQNADKILVIDKGKVIEEGTHDLLLKQNGFYAKMYTSQFKSGVSSEIN